MTPLPTHIHMLGIGGMGMAPLALYLRQTGIRVSGEDDHFQAEVETTLRRNGIDIGEGESARRLRERAPMLAWSSAIAKDDPRLEQARRQDVHVLRRGELLALVVKGRKLVAIAGSHGKTTTTAMVIHALKKLGFSFDYILGGFFRDENILPSGYMGSDWVVAEIDESDGTIAGFHPEITLQINFDWDHPDQYPNLDAVEDMVQSLFSRTVGSVLIPSNSELLKRIAIRSSKTYWTFGYSGNYAGVCRESSLDSLKIELAGLFPINGLSVCVGGEFNATNALAALAAVHLVAKTVKEDLLEDFVGIRRRQDKLYSVPGLSIYADYAHHPGEIGALLKHFSAVTGGRVGVVFQPHRYTRTRQYAEGFAQALVGVDCLVLLPVYAASEPADPLGQTSSILEKIKQPSSAVYCQDYESMEAHLNASIDHLDIVLFVGAGDIDTFAHRYVESRIAFSKVNDWFSRLQGEVSAEAYLARNERLDKRTTIRIGGEAKWYAEPGCVDDLEQILRAAHKNHIDVFFLGRGSNLLIADSGYPGLVLNLQHSYWKEIEPLDEKRLRVGSGVRLQALSAKACKLGMGGFEFLEGIPGSVGGALRMNAGAMGGWMFDVVESVEFVTLQGNLFNLPKEAFHVGYRYCEELKTGIATSAVLRCSELLDTEVIRQKMLSFSEHRVNSQPREPSAGCMFKNPEGGHAGKIIDQLGLKGFRVGNAEISPIHANFIVNHGGATCADIIEIMRHVRRETFSKLGVELQPEVMLIGERWENVL